MAQSEVRRLLETSPDEIILAFPNRLWLPTYVAGSRTSVHIQAKWRTHIIALCNNTIELGEERSDLPKCRSCVQLLVKHDLWEGPVPSPINRRRVADDARTHILLGTAVYRSQGRGQYFCSCGYIGWAQRYEYGKGLRDIEKRLVKNFNRHVFRRIDGRGTTGATI